MERLSRLLGGLVCCAVSSLLWPCAHGAPLELASATMGPVRWPGGQSLSSQQLLGWRFEATQQIAVTAVGGHLIGVNGELFAALVKLDAKGELPDGAPLEEDEIVAHVEFVAPNPSAEIMLPLEATLQAGHYALVFGSGLFGAAGSGAMVNNSQQPNIPPTTTQSYLRWGPVLPGVSQWRSGTVDNLRFVVVAAESAGAADFNLDNLIDGSDLGMWQSHFGDDEDARRSDGDATGDGSVDGADLLAWQRTASGAAPGLADFNRDSAVNAADLASWRQGFGLSVGAQHNQGDATGDGAVDGADLLAWQQALSVAAAAAAATAIPEPHFAMWATALLAAARLRLTRTTRRTRRQNDQLRRRVVVVPPDSARY